MESVQAALIAGGAGTRLSPVTDVLPKVLVPIGGRPVLEHTLDAIEQAGVETVHLMLGRHADLVKAYVATIRARRPRLRIHTLTEQEALGTAGPLRLLDGTARDLLVMNGDIVTGADLEAVVDDHLESGAELTVVGVPYKVDIPFGVVHTDGDGRVQRIEEKPALRPSVAAGIYVVGPGARARVRREGPDSMPELIRRVLADGLLVRQYELAEQTLWCEVGEPLSYMAAQQAQRAAG